MRLAAAADDIDALHTELCRLRSALADHIRNEVTDLASLTEPTAEVVARGQRQLLGLADELLEASAPGSPHPDHQCRCLQRSAELSHLLTRQARLEAGVLLARTRSAP